MSKPASWTAKENGLPDWTVTAFENLERELKELREAVRVMPNETPGDVDLEWLLSQLEAMRLDEPLRRRLAAVRAKWSSMQRRLAHAEKYADDVHLESDLVRKQIGTAASEKIAAYAERDAVRLELAALKAKPEAPADVERAFDRVWQNADYGDRQVALHYFRAGFAASAAERERLLRDRDELWCRALIETDSYERERVLHRFNAMRTYKLGALSSGQGEERAKHDIY